MLVLLFYALSRLVPYNSLATMNHDGTTEINKMTKHQGPISIPRDAVLVIGAWSLVILMLHTAAL